MVYKLRFFKMIPNLHERKSPIPFGGIRDVRQAPFLAVCLCFTLKTCFVINENVNGKR